MDNTAKILRQIPLFKHCTDDEMGYLYRMGRLSHIKKGQRLDVKTLKSLCVVASGVFEIEAVASSDLVYLAPGSFFGNIPFIQDRQHGTVRSLTEASLLMLGEDELKKFFLQSFKSLRGYGEILHRLNFDSTEAARNIQSKKCCVVTVFSASDQTGKSFVSALASVRLSEKDKTIVLDISNGNASVFDYLNSKIIPPLSQKQTSDSSTELLIKDRIVEVNSQLHLLNITYGSRVSVDSSIISPLIFFLSQHYKYLIIDLAGGEGDLSERVLAESDIILAVAGSDKSESRMSGLIDRYCTQGQRVFNIYNEFVGGKIKKYESGLILGAVDFKGPEISDFEELAAIRNDTINRIVELISRKNSVLVLESGLLEAVAFAPYLVEEDILEKYTSFYTSAYSYLVLMLALGGEGREGAFEDIIKFFGGTRLNHLLDVTFPEDFVFRGDRVSKRMHEIAGSGKIESWTSVPMALGVSAEGKRRIFSSGMTRSVMEASFMLEPVFEPAIVSGSEYYSGYPGIKVSVEDIIRTDVDEITYMSVNNSEQMAIKGNRVLNFYQKFINHLELQQEDEKRNQLADQSIEINIDQKYFSIESIFEAVEERK